MDYGERIDNKRTEQFDIYGNIEFVRALNRAQSNILYYAQYCDELMAAGKAIESVPIELMMTAADESVFIMKQYSLLEKRYIRLAKQLNKKTGMDDF